MRASSSLRRARRLAASAFALSANVLACCRISAHKGDMSIQRSSDTADVQSMDKLDSSQTASLSRASERSALHIQLQPEHTP